MPRSSNDQIWGGEYFGKDGALARKRRELRRKLRETGDRAGVWSERSSNYYSVAGSLRGDAQEAYSPVTRYYLLTWALFYFALGLWWSEWLEFIYGKRLSAAQWEVRAAWLLRTAVGPFCKMRLGHAERVCERALVERGITDETRALLFGRLAAITWARRDRERSIRNYGEVYEMAKNLPAKTSARLIRDVAVFCAESGAGAPKPFFREALLRAEVAGLADTAKKIRAEARRHGIVLPL